MKNIDSVASIIRIACTALPSSAEAACLTLKIGILIPLYSAQSVLTSLQSLVEFKLLLDNQYNSKADQYELAAYLNVRVLLGEYPPVDEEAE